VGLTKENDPTSPDPLHHRLGITSGGGVINDFDLHLPRTWILFQDAF
jgi:hypothetical protein